MSRANHNGDGDERSTDEENSQGQPRDFPTPEGPQELGTHPMKKDWVAIPPEPGSYTPGRGIMVRKGDLEDLSDWE